MIYFSLVLLKHDRRRYTMKRTRQENEVIKIPSWRDVLAGAAAGTVSKSAMAPVERVKLLMQLQGSADGIAGQSAWKVAVSVYRNEGISAFWRGNIPNVMRTAGQAALNMALMDYYKEVASSPWVQNAIIEHSTQEDVKRRRQLAVSFISGGLAGGSATTLLYPTEFLRTRLAMDQGRSKGARKYNGMKDVVMTTLRTDGFRGLYQGYGIALWGSVLYRLLFLGGHDAIKGELQYFKKQKYGDIDYPMTMTERLFLAQSIALTAGTICYPIDSVRRRLMMQAGIPENDRKYRGSIDCFRVVFKQEGIRGFFLGIGPNLVRSIGGALMLVAYDLIKINL
jgi:solute carrier family 25 (adenine nucleotide translocator) protein 4/5/6/31